MSSKIESPSGGEGKFLNRIEKWKLFIVFRYATKSNHRSFAYKNKMCKSRNRSRRSESQRILSRRDDRQSHEEIFQFRSMNFRFRVFEFPNAIALERQPYTLRHFSALKVSNSSDQRRVKLS